jgi:hypothetical protein
MDVSAISIDRKTATVAVLIHRRVSAMAKLKDAVSATAPASGSEASATTATAPVSTAPEKVSVPAASESTSGNGSAPVLATDPNAPAVEGETEARRQTVYIRMENRTPGTPEYDDALDLIARSMGGPFTLQSGLVQKFGLDLSRFTMGGIKKVAESLTPDNIATLKMFNSSI